MSRAQAQAVDMPGPYNAALNAFNVATKEAMKWLDKATKAAMDEASRQAYKKATQPQVSPDSEPPAKRQCSGA